MYNSLVNFNPLLLSSSLLCFYLPQSKHGKGPHRLFLSFSKVQDGTVEDKNLKANYKLPRQN